jgi:ABC-type oligopeptide transport system ATPase subunit
VSLAIRRGQCFGLVGESGCGKTTLSKVIMRAMEPDGGNVVYNDRGTMIDVTHASGDTLMQFRRRVQYIFQDPFGSLSPRMTVFDILREPLVIHRIGDADYRAEMAKELMRLVGLDPRYLNRYPHSFSGGQRQRIGIARALALSPDLILCDEPVSALDVSIQAQILNLLEDLQEEFKLTYLFIAHDLKVVEHISTRVAVMYLGKIVETAEGDTLYRTPKHPSTGALLSAVPIADPEKAKAKRRIILEIVEQVDHLRLDRHVERRDGLVGDVELGVQGQRPRDPDPLPLAARELVRIAVVVLGREAHELEQLGHVALDLAAVADVVDAQRIADDRAHPLARVERSVRVLEDHLHLPAQRLQLAAGELGDVAALEVDRARGELEQADDAAAERRLAATRFAHEPECLAGSHLEADAVHGVHPGDLALDDDALLDREVLADVVDLQERPAVLLAHADSSISSGWIVVSRRAALVAGSR